MHRVIRIAALSTFFAFSFALNAQTAGRYGRPLINQRIDESKLHTLSGNTHPAAIAANDRGAVPANFMMSHMMLQLKRSAEQELRLEQTIAQMHNPKSPLFHRWLTATQFGEQFGAAQQDIEAVTQWLTSHGFKVHEVYPSGMLIDFSGTAAQVRNAFHTEVHYLDVDGVRHSGNMSDPQIPEALAAVVRGVASMHDFKPRTMKRARLATREFTFGFGQNATQAVVPGDLATIYNFNPAFAAGYTGKGQTIAVIEDSDLFSTDDWNTFRSTFGLTQYTSGSLTTVYPAGSAGHCEVPGVNSDDSEAILDAEWASAAAPDAAIVVATCNSTDVTFGGLIAMANLINGTNPPQIMSISYGNCEAENGEASNASYNAIYQQAVAEGVSIFVAAGDEGAASCDAGAKSATHGIGVSAFASTPYNVAVGGTDFSDAYANTISQYWNSKNSPVYDSAISYIPEIPWNDSCAGSLLASAFGYSTTYGSNGFCSSSTAQEYQLLVVAAGSGGPSGCATGAPSLNGVVSGSCQGFGKPAWQSGLAGIPADGVRDIPDLSMFAADGVWGHYYVFCWSDTVNGGAPCTGDPSNWAGAGGTSFGAPIMAGAQALINQAMSGAQGNPNYVYYALAANGSNVCDSSSGDSGACVFHNVTLGDMTVNCGGAENCFGTGAPERGIGRRQQGNGALSTSTSTYSPAYLTGTGWNFATGIGSVNVFNLLNSWMTTMQSGAPQ